MMSNCIVRYVSGREERFAVELFGGASAVDRLKEFVKNPTILLQLDNEVLVIPATAIECITLALPTQRTKKSPCRACARAIACNPNV